MTKTKLTSVYLTKELEKRKKYHFAKWQQGNYKNGYIDALENFKLWLLSLDK